MFNSFLYILSGLKFTLSIYFLTLIFSVPLAIFLAFLGEKKTNWYTLFFRGTPLLLQLFFVYYGLPLLGIIFSAFTASILTFTLNYTAYFLEIFRGSLKSIDIGQYEAAKLLGYSKAQTYIYIILPQCFRVSIPALSNEFLSLIKDTSLVSVIGLSEILRTSKEIVSTEFSLYPFIICALIYLILSVIIIFITKKIEKKLVI